MTSVGRCRGHLTEQLCRILEETAFMLVETTEAPLPPPSRVIEASLSFGGLLNGTCWLVVSEEDARQLATEMLGAEPIADSNSSVCDNATSELLNILTAWFLEDWWGADVEHSLGIPETCRKLLTETRIWSLPDADRVIVFTDTGCTFLSGVTTE